MLPGYYPWPGCPSWSPAASHYTDTWKCRFTPTTYWFHTWFHTYPQYWLHTWLEPIPYWLHTTCTSYILLSILSSLSGCPSLPYPCACWQLLLLNLQHQLGLTPRVVVEVVLARHRRRPHLLAEVASSFLFPLSPSLGHSRLPGNLGTQRNSWKIAFNAALLASASPSCSSSSS